VVRKFNNRLFLGVPLTSKIKENKFYHAIHLKGKTSCVMLSQIKTWEGKRLNHKLGDLTKEQFEEIRGKIKEIV
jgi:mRNA interferase MazF